MVPCFQCYCCYGNYNKQWQLIRTIKWRYQSGAAKQRAKEIEAKGKKTLEDCGLIYTRRWHVFGIKLPINLNSSRSPNPESSHQYTYCAKITLRFNLRGSKPSSGHAPQTLQDGMLCMLICFAHYQSTSFI